MIENKLKSIKICPECNGHIVQNNFEQVCESCGLILESLFLVDSYQFNETKNSDMTPADQYVSIGKTLDSVCTLGSHIDYYSSKFFFDSKHNAISSNNQKKFRKLKKYYSLPSKIKNHETDYRILKILSKVSQILLISDSVKKRAAYFYQTIKRKSKKIKNHVSMIGFCMYYASREYCHNSPVSLKELCKIFNTLGHRINPKLIIRDSIAYKKLINIKSKPHKSEDYINRFISGVVNSPLVWKRMEKKKSLWKKDEYKNLLMNKCLQSLKSLNKRTIGSRNPFILAASMVYCADKILAIEHKTKPILTQKVAAKAMKIAEYSIRDHYVKILKPIFIQN